MVAGGGLQIFQWAPDNSRLLYIAEEETVGLRELYIVRPDGSGHVKASGLMTPGKNGVLGPVATWAPDSSRVAYTAYQDPGSVIGVYTSLADGTGNVRVSGSAVAGGTVGGPVWSPDSSKIAYVGELNTLNAYEIFAVSPDGTGNVQICPPYSAGRKVESLLSTSPVHFNNWATDSSRIAYIANQDTATMKELYTVRPDGTGNTKVSGPIVAGGLVREFGWPYNSGASSRIAYAADQDTAGVIELYTSLAGGGGNAKVSSALVAGGNVVASLGSYGSFWWAWDGSRIGYRADGTTAGVHELYSALPDTSAGTVKVSGTLLGGEVTDFVWAPDNARLAYRAQQSTPGIYDLYSSLAAGGGNVKLSPTIVSGTGLKHELYITSFLSPRLFFMASTSTGTPIELYSALPDGSSTLKLSGSLVPGGNVQSFVTR
jgi:hypothetical protein